MLADDIIYVVVVVVTGGGRGGGVTVACQVSCALCSVCVCFFYKILNGMLFAFSSVSPYFSHLLCAHPRFSGLFQPSSALGSGQGTVPISPLVRAADLLVGLLKVGALFVSR